jgi:hypothetical protein
MLKKLEALLAEVVAARDAAGVAKPDSLAGEMVDRQSYDEYKRATQKLEEARGWLLIHEQRVSPTA